MRVAWRLRPITIDLYRQPRDPIGAVALAVDAMAGGTVRVVVVWAAEAPDPDDPIEEVVLVVVVVGASRIAPQEEEDAWGPWTKAEVDFLLIAVVLLDEAL